MKLSECENCKYCQKRWNRDNYGNFLDGYYGCNYSPHWGKHIETIGICPKGKEPKEKDVYRYKISLVENSINKCDICGKTVTELYYQIEEREFLNIITSQKSWTRNECNSYFGHKDCLKSKQR